MIVSELLQACQTDFLVFDYAFGGGVDYGPLHLGGLPAGVADLGKD